MLIQILTSTPVTFALVLAVLAVLNAVVRRHEAPGPDSKRELEAYACGQRDTDHFVAPKYYRAFAFAFFFTVMHVLVLVVATAPRAAVALPVAYVAAAMLVIIMLFRRQPEDEHR